MAYTTIDDPSSYFQTTLYTGNGGTQSITNTGNSDLQPDWIWTKVRSETGSHRLVDTVRGITKPLFSNGTDAEGDETNYSAFNSDGFSLVNNSLNENNRTYVAWQWKAGGSASSNSNGSITSSVSAGSIQGFSVVSYTGGGGGKTVGHGLGVAPKMIILKARNSGDYNWSVWHSGLSTPTTARLALNTTGAQSNNSSFWNDAVPTSTLFSLGSDGTHNANGTTYIAYCFAEKQGYSKFGSYTGNGNADGPFIYTGFQPAFFLVKRSDSTTSWTLLDNKRDPFNVTTERLFPNENVAGSVGTNANTDFLSNGVKIRVNHNNFNTSGGTYIYMAFAENPFVTSTGVPATAR